VTQPVSGTFFQATQPVSGTVTANLASGTNNIGDVDVLTLPAITGSVTANAGTNLNTSALALDATLTGGTQTTRVTDGTNTATVKAASTVAASTDPALVVAVSPNIERTASGTVTTTLNTNVVIATDGGMQSVVMLYTWAVGSTGTVDLQVSYDGGTNWSGACYYGVGASLVASLPFTPTSCGTLAVSSVGVLQTAVVGVANATNFRVRNSGSLSVGTLTISLRAGPSNFFTSRPGEYGTSVSIPNTATDDYNSGASISLFRMIGVAIPSSSGPQPGGDAFNPFQTSMRLGTTAASTGNGVSGSGTLRVSVASDSTGQIKLTDGTTTAAVKAASTAAVATDPAVVVAISPNNTVPTDLALVAGATTQTGNGTAAGSLRVSLASDSTGQVTLAAGTNGIGKLTANSGVVIGDVNVVSEIPGTGATNLGKAEDATHTSGDVGIMAMGIRKDTNAQTTNADGDYTPGSFDAYGAQFTRVDHPNRFRCTVTVSTATAITALGGSCAAPGAGLSIYITDIEFSSSAAGIAADAFPTLKYGTGGTCGTGTTVFWGALSAAAIRAEKSYATPIKIPANNEVCWITSTAGSKFIVVTGYIAP
jgi:hypothetical protein